MGTTIRISEIGHIQTILKTLTGEASISSYRSAVLIDFQDQDDYIKIINILNKSKDINVISALDEFPEK
jgi:hypothetical protein